MDRDHRMRYVPPGQGACRRGRSCASTPSTRAPAGRRPSGRPGPAGRRPWVSRSGRPVSGVPRRRSVLAGRKPSVGRPALGARGDTALQREWSDSWPPALRPRRPAPRGAKGPTGRRRCPRGRRRPRSPARSPRRESRLEALHVGGVVALGDSAREILLVHHGQGVAVQFDAEAGPVGHGYGAVDEPQARPARPRPRRSATGVGVAGVVRFGVAAARWVIAARLMPRWVLECMDSASPNVRHIAAICADVRARPSSGGRSSTHLDRVRGDGRRQVLRRSPRTCWWPAASAPRRRPSPCRGCPGVGSSRYSRTPSSACRYLDRGLDGPGGVRVEAQRQRRGTPPRSAMIASTSS